MDRSNHYEGAFEAYLQWHRLCYVAVDETRRSMLGDTGSRERAGRHCRGLPRVVITPSLTFGSAGSGYSLSYHGREWGLFCSRVPE